VRESLFLAYEKSQRAVRDRRWKLIRYPLVDRTQLFDLAADPHELQNLADRNPRKVRELTALLQEWQKKLGDRAPLTVANPRPATFDHRAAEARRRPDRWQPREVVDRYFAAWKARHPEEYRKRYGGG
jgi:arylsulfatase A-like enzyme